MILDVTRYQQKLDDLWQLYKAIKSTQALIHRIEELDGCPIRNEILNESRDLLEGVDLYEAAFISKRYIRDDGIETDNVLD